MTLSLGDSHSLVIVIKEYKAYGIEKKIAEPIRF